MTELPNIILVILDAVRADHLSCYGYPRQTTSFIDQIASQGVVFTDCTAPAPWTLPSHASLFTGTYPSRHEADFSNPHLTQGLVTLAEVLSSQGYQTLGLSSNVWLRSETGMSRGFETYQSVNEPSVGKGTIFHKLLYYGYKEYLKRFSDRGASRVAKGLQHWLVNEFRSDKPLFMFINYLESHLPYRRLAVAYLREFAQGNDARAVNQDAWAYFTGKVVMTENDFTLLKAYYDATIRYTDDQFRRLWHLLEAHRILDDAVVVITSDHGENLGDHGLMDHQYSLHETVLKIPLVIWAAGGRVNGGRRAGDLVQTCDIFPTLMELIECRQHAAHDQFQGVSFLPLLGGGPYDTGIRSWVAAEYLSPNLGIFRRCYPDFDYRDFDYALRSFRQGSWKYIWRSDGSEQLFNLLEDPHETTDLADRYPEQLSNLRRGLERHVGPPNIGDGVGKDVLFDDPIVVERLKSLGYI